ncbi:hypothetical protein WJX73_000866 [Symbiochloris irregularis]|uniref:Uncharacterized protein n=1 Tax=Symbiochloris irregularis TaxID=706552 RepID=A0AAW1P1G5_9CHLO
MLEDVVPHLVSISYVLQHTEPEDLEEMARTAIQPDGSVSHPGRAASLEAEIAASKFGPFTAPFLNCPKLAGILPGPSYVQYLPRFGMSLFNRLMSSLMRTHGLTVEDVLLRARGNLDELAKVLGCGVDKLVTFSD